jgi:hypothetical protein
MEYYVAEDQSPLDRCLADVRSSDVYIGIFAWRYGAIPEIGNPDGLSFAELEYRCAAESGKTCLIFLLSEDASWPRSKMDRDLTRIENLRQELKSSGRLVATFVTTDELARKVTEAVVAWERQSGLAVQRKSADWHTYRTAVLDRHRWVRLQVIAGASRERDPLRIPLTEVFEPQLVIAGASGTDVPDEVRQYQQEIYGVRDSAADESAEAAAETEEQLFAGSPEPVLDVLGRERTQVFLGGPGSGKSTLLQYAMLRVCEPAAPDAVPRHLTGEPVPFLVDLRTYVLRKDPDFVSYLTRRSAEFYGIETGAEAVGKALAEDGGAVVFFDGLDEVFDPDDRRRIIDQFQAFASRYPGCRVVVTSRIAGYDRTSLGLAGFAHYTVMPLTLGHIRNFADRWYRHYTLEGTERTAQGLVQRIVESPRLLDLAGNPLLLTMMAVIYKDRDLPNERWRLYERCAETLLEDWDLSKGIEDEDFKLAVAIRTAQKSEMLQRVARYMLDHAQPGSELNAIAYGPLREILAGYLAVKYQCSDGEAEAIAVDILRHLMERTYVLAGVGERVFGFVHRTFMEYFAACSCLAEFNARKSDFTWLNEEIFGAHWQDPAWEEVLLLLIAMLHDQGTPIGDVVTALLRPDRSDSLPCNLAFAARCLGEAGDVQDQAQAVDVLGELARHIVTWVDSRGDAAKRFVEMALGAFAALAPLVNDVPPAVPHVMSLLDPPVGGRVPGRIAAWQMEYALRSRKERLGFALAALRDPEEAVRRAAVAVLEREWPGRPDIAPLLAEVVKSDRQARVRMAALQVMQRSWQHDPAILDAIESRVGRETAYTVVVHLIEYLASAWPGNPRALRLVMGLASPWVSTGVLTAGVVGVARAWPRATEELSHLLDLTLRASAVDREAVLTELAGLAVIPRSLLDFLMARAVNDPYESVRASILGRLVQIPEADDPGLRALPRDLAVSDASAQVRGIALAPLVESWLSAADAADADLVMDRATNDPDPYVRSVTLLMLAYKGRHVPAAWDFLLDRAVSDPDPSVRALVLEALAETLGYSVAAGSQFPWWPREADEPTSIARAGWLSRFTEISIDLRIDPESWSFLRDRAENEPDPAVRQRLFLSLIGKSHRYPDLRVFLQDWAAHDPDAETRAALGEMLERLAHVDPVAD